MIVDRRNEEGFDQFPVGMRVLAVDDDPICLRLLETLLRKCQYHVTTRDRAIDALELLRENRDKFDLVISDVHMPDMDGFKLLELVGLEMDLPVIMLSANGDTKLVMKGITHGACDYLLKPVRLEELKNIWQHVVRRKKLDKKHHNNREKRSYPADEGQRYSRIGDSDQVGRHGKRRKDHEEDDDEDGDENGHDNDDSSSQKKSRVVWSVELHRKFVAAVNQLGFDRAVPKKILELMNVEKLTRENVASHLQKYRLYLKRLSSVANQQAHMVAALGGADPSYLRMNFHNFNGPAQFPNNALRSIPPVGVLGRLNSPAGLGVHGLSPSGIGPLNHSQMARSLITDGSKFQMHSDQSGSILQGMPTSLGFDHISPDVSRLGSGSQTAMQPMLDSNGARSVDFAMKPQWHSQKVDVDFRSSSRNPSMAAQGAGSANLVGDPNDVFFGGSNEFSMGGHSNLDSSSAQDMAAGFHVMDSTPNLGGFEVSQAGSLEDVVSSMIKWEQEDAALNRGSDLGGDAYTLGTCI